MSIITLNEFLNNISKYIHPNKKPFIIGITGGSGSGKNFTAKKILKKLVNSSILSIDDYYLDSKDFENENRDIPSAIDLNLIQTHLTSLKSNNQINKPIFNFKTHLRESYEKFSPSDIIILEGLFSLNEKFLPLLDLKIFIDSNEKIRLNRRILRDTNTRGDTQEQILKRWNSTVEPMFKEHILPQKSNSDMIIENN